MTFEKEPLVSILIPCFQHALYVEKTLNSVLEDSYPNKEIVIIDDGSKDESPQIITNWIQKNCNAIQVIFIQRSNRGLCNTLNELVEMASGKYLLPLASDDKLKNNNINNRIQLLEQNPNYLVCLSDCEVIDENEKIIYNSSIQDFFKRPISAYQTLKKLQKEIITHFSIAGPSVLMHKDIFKIIGLYPTNGNAEDWFFYQRAVSKNLLVFYPQIAAQYRHHENNHFVQPQKQIKIVISILHSVISNISWYPSLKFKLFGIYQIVRMLYGIYLLKWKIVKTKHDNS